MLGAILLPVLITFLLFGSLTAMLIIYTSIIKKKPCKIIGKVLLITIMVFIPSCLGVQSLVDHYMYGTFHYANYEEIDASGIYTHLPLTATNIDVEAYQQGFKARFNILESDLNEWFDDVWEKAQNIPVNSKQGKEKVTTYELDRFLYSFEGDGWVLPTKVIAYEGPRKTNGAGFTLWFDKESNLAYQRVGYW